jgi:hypothetical protein
VAPYGALLLYLWVGPRVHPACFLGSELSDGFDQGGKAGCGTAGYGSARVGLGVRS